MTNKSKIVVIPKKPLVRVQQGLKNDTNLVVKKAPNLTLGSLLNVDVANNQDNYTLVFDMASNTWISAPITNVDIDLSNILIDGGWYNFQ